jgi:hypothetical protein
MYSSLSSGNFYVRLSVLNSSPLLHLQSIPDIYGALGGAANFLANNDKHIEEGAAWAVEFMVTLVYTFTYFAATDLVQVQRSQHAGVSDHFPPSALLNSW